MNPLYLQMKAKNGNVVNENLPDKYIPNDLIQSEKKEDPRLEIIKDEVYRRYIAGQPVQTIAKLLNLKSEDVLSWIQEALKIASEDRRALQNDVLEAEITRLECIMVILTKNIQVSEVNGRVDHQSIKQLMEIADRKARYLGLYSKKHVEPGLKLEDLLKDL